MCTCTSGSVTRFSLLNSILTKKIQFGLLFQVVSGKCFVYAFWPSDFSSSVFGVFLVVIEFLGPLIILIYCYGRIVWILTRRIDSNLDNTGTQTDKFQLARRNTIKLFLLISLCFIICWSSVQVYYLMFNLGYHADFNGTFFKFSVIMAFGNCTVNPFIYLIKYQDYQRALRSFFRCQKKQNVDGLNISKSMSRETLATIGGFNLVW